MIITVLTLSIVLPTPIDMISQQQEASAQTNDNNTFKLNENPSYGIHIQYPFNWRVDEGDVDSDDAVTDIVSFVALIGNDSETDGPSLYMSIDNQSSNLNENLNEYLTTLIDDYNDTEDFEVIESNTNSTLAGKLAYKLVFTDVYDDDINYESMEIGTIIGDKVYIATYEAEEEQYSDYLPTVQKMIDSLKINASNN
jgi:serine/threonine-protein kinase